MNWLDFLILVSLGILGLVGWRMGIIRGVLTVVGIYLGIFLAGQFGEDLGAQLEFIDNPNGAKVLGNAIVFALVLVAATIASSMLRRFIQIFFLEWVDNAGGAVLGLVACSLVVSGAIIAAGSFPFGGLDDTIEESTMATALADNTPFVLNMLPEKYQDILAYAAKEVEPPAVTLSDIRVRVDSPNQAKIELELILDNPNSFGGAIQQVSGSLFWEEDDVLHPLGPIPAAQEQRLETKGETRLPIVVEVAESPEFPVGELARRVIQDRGVRVMVKDGWVTVVFRPETVMVPFEGSMIAQWEE